jgi:hypothetical protein
LYKEWSGVHKGAHAFLTGNLVPANRLLQQALAADALQPYMGKKLWEEEGRTRVLWFSNLGI